MLELIIHALLALLVPAGISAAKCCIKGKKGKELLKETVLITVCSIAILTGAFVIKRGSWTAYEFLLMDSLSASLLSFLLFPIIRSKKCEVTYICEFLCAMCVSVVAYSVLTYGQTVIHSDTATSIILSDSMMRHHSYFPSTWNYVNGEVWTICTGTFCIFPSILLQDQSLARMIGSLITIVLTYGGIIFLSRKIFRNNSWLLSIPLVFVFVCTSPNIFTYGMTDMLLYQAAYSPQILWLAFCTALIIELFCSEHGKWSKRYIIVYGLLMIGLCAGGSRILAEQTLPILCTCVVMIYLDLVKQDQITWKPALKKMGYMTAVIAVPALIGCIVYKCLCTRLKVTFTQNNAFVFADSLESIWNNLWFGVRDLFGCFGFDGGVQLLSIAGLRNFVSVVICAMVCFVVPVLQWRKFKEENAEVQFFFTFSMIHNLIMFVLAVFFGKMTSPRYWLTTIACFVLVSARYIYVYWLGQKNFQQYIWAGLFAIACVIECIGLGMMSAGWADNLAQKKAFNQVLVDHNLTKGYATYWNAYSNEVYSDLQIRYGGVNIGGNGISPYLWLVDGDVYEPEGGIRSFLLLSEEENQQIGTEINVLFGTPVETFMIDTSYVYVFDHDIASDMR